MRFELRYMPLALPKFYVVAIDELLGTFPGSVIIGTNEGDGPEEMTVYSNNVCSIIWH